MKTSYFDHVILLEVEYRPKGSTSLVERGILGQWSGHLRAEGSLVRASAGLLLVQV